MITNSPFYIFDDFAGDSLTGRVGQSSLRFIDDHGCPNDAMTRPNWETESGSPTIGSGSLSFPAGDTTIQSIGIPTSLAYAQFEVDVQLQTTPTDNAFAIDMIENDQGDYIQLALDDSGVRVVKFDGSGTTIVSNVAADTTNDLRITVSFRESEAVVEVWDRTADTRSTSGFVSHDVSLVSRPWQLYILNASDVTADVTRFAVRRI
jgi:hypothetical protein